MRVENESRGRAVLAKPVQHHVEQRRFSRAHFAGQQDDASAPADAIGQASQGFLNSWRQEQIPGIRVDPEWALS